jgi:hypothetical protein
MPLESFQCPLSKDIIDPSSWIYYTDRESNFFGDQVFELTVGGGCSRWMWIIP